ncbi:MAG: polysaccharide pyruvyl transferase family protein [Propionibacteriaceae bacterium]|jgi:hypothetical protein|nr:polysaccharide pyruvyl transferase family protein [Propionibacteriaceae bacterium]
MQEILVRGGRPPHVPVSPEASLARHGYGVFGGNVGNTLFLSSVFRQLNTASHRAVVDSSYLERNRSEPKSLAAQINERFSAYAIPLANAFRPGWETSLSRLTEIIDHLTIPVVVVGVGVQAGVGRVESIPSSVRDAATRFVEAVLDHSASVGVRGELTASFLHSCGFSSEEITVIGCPSLFNNPGDLQVMRRVSKILPDDPIAINMAPSAFSANLRVFNSMLRRYPNMIYVAQQFEELEMLLWGTDWTTKYPGLPLHTDHHMYEEDRIRFFLDPIRWAEFMRTRLFAFGSRIHGNIAAISAGTPALVIAHDSRVSEIANYHRIPTIPSARDLDDSIVDTLYELADYSEFNKQHPENFARYTQFLEANGLAHIYQPGQANPGYDKLLSEVDFPSGVGVVEAHLNFGGRELLRKLAWLRQGMGEDKKRWVGGYMPAFRPSGK